MPLYDFEHLRRRGRDVGAGAVDGRNADAAQHRMVLRRNDPAAHDRDVDRPERAQRVDQRGDQRLVSRRSIPRSPPTPSSSFWPETSLRSSSRTTHRAGSICS